MFFFVWPDFDQFHFYFCLLNLTLQRNEISKRFFDRSSWFESPELHKKHEIADVDAYFPPCFLSSMSVSMFIFKLHRLWS